MTENFMGILLSETEIIFLLQINASTEQEARQKFIEYHAPTDEALKETVFGNSKGWIGLLDNFLCDGEEDFDEKRADDPEYVRKYIEKGVYDYFGPQHRDYAQIYLKHVNEIGEVDLESRFPLDMLIFMALKRDWYENLTIVLLNDVDQI